eukprot:scaffold61435_cov63-Phaeocystis_antarctica.AAC.2
MVVIPSASSSVDRGPPPWTDLKAVSSPHVCGGSPASPHRDQPTPQTKFSIMKSATTTRWAKASASVASSAAGRRRLGCTQRPASRAGSMRHACVRATVER